MGRGDWSDCLACGCVSGTPIRETVTVSAGAFDGVAEGVSGRAEAVNGVFEGASGAIEAVAGVIESVAGVTEGGAVETVSPIFEFGRT